MHALKIEKNSGKKKTYAGQKQHSAATRERKRPKRLDVCEAKEMKTNGKTGRAGFRTQDLGDQTKRLLPLHCCCLFGIEAEKGHRTTYKGGPWPSMVARRSPATMASKAATVEARERQRGCGSW